MKTFDDNNEDGIDASDRELTLEVRVQYSLVNEKGSIKISRLNLRSLFCFVLFFYFDYAFFKLGLSSFVLF